ncbi:MAG: S-layer homology domain-containing protein [Firmicutes bacterium]|jgi:hypothetical protein|nr:S-layer homology domain-containing protein [Bacillota bacterium]
MKSYLYKYVFIVLVLVLLLSSSFSVTDYSRITELEIIKGDEHGMRLNDIVTRKELAVIIARLMGESTYAENYPVKSIFKDVEDSYYSSYIAWAYSKGYFEYLGSEIFGPDDAIDDKEYERSILKVLGYEIPDRYIDYKAKELDIDIVKTDKVTRKMMVESIANALDLNLNGRNVTLYENLIEQKLNKNSRSIVNIEVLSLKNVVVKFSESISSDSLGIEIVDKSNPFKKTNVKEIDYLGSNTYLLNLGRMDGSKEYYLKYNGINYPFSPKKNTGTKLFVNKLKVIDNDKVLISFNDRLVPNSANDISKYGIEGIKVINAKVSESLDSVILTTEKVEKNSYYSLFIENIEALDGKKLEREEFIIQGDVDLEKPMLLSAEIRSNDRIELIFNDLNGLDDLSLKNIKNYSIISDSGKVDIDSVSTIEIPEKNHTKAVIKSSNTLEKASYNIIISNIKDNSNSKNTMDKKNIKLIQDNLDFKGPEILSVEALGKNRLNVKIFDDSKLQKKQIFNAGNYHINNNIQITNIYFDNDGYTFDDNVTSIIIETTNMSRDTKYMIGFENISDEYGNTISMEDIAFDSKVVDNVSPKISEIVVIDENTIGVRFDEKINKVNCMNTENFIVDNLVGNPNEVIYDNKEDQILLKVSNLEKGKEYLLSVKNILDYNMNEMGTKSHSFVYNYLNTEYFVKEFDFINSNTFRIDFNSNIGNVKDIKVILENTETNEILECNSLWFRDEDESVVYFKSGKVLKAKDGYRIKSISGLFIEKKLRSISYYNDSSVENNEILGYKIFGNNEIMIFLSQAFYIDEDKVSSNIESYNINKDLNAISLKFNDVFQSKDIYLDLSYIKNISGRSFFNPNDYSGRHKFVVNFKNVNPVDHVEVYNYYNLSIFHDKPVFGKYYKVFNISDSLELDLLNVNVDDGNSTKVNILINDRLEEDDRYIIKVYNDPNYTNEVDSETFKADFDQYLIAKVIDNSSIEIYNDYVNEYNVTLYKVDSNYKKIGDDLIKESEEIGSKFVVHTSIELLNESDYLLDYGNGEIYLKGKAPTIDSQVFAIADPQYTGKLTIDEDIVREEEKKYSGKLYRIDSMDEIEIYDGVENQYLIKEPINIGEKMLFRFYEDDILKYSSEIVVKDNIKDYYMPYFEKINMFDSEKIARDLRDLSQETAYFAKDDIKSENALYYIDNLKIKNEYTIYELYTIIKGVNSYYGSSMKDEVEELLMNLENLTYILDDDLTIAYCLSNYNNISNEIRRLIENLPNEEKTEYISKVDSIEKKIIDSVSISKLELGREKMLNKKSNSTSFSANMINNKGIDIGKSIDRDGIEIDYEWEVLKFDADKYTYSREIDNITIQDDGNTLSIIIKEEKDTEGIYKIKLKVEEVIFENTVIEVLGEGELIIQ